MASKKNSKNVSRHYFKSNEELQEKDEASLRKNTRNKRKLLDMLGSQWNKEEVESFYEAYRKHGRDWRKIAAAVRSRSPEKVEALYCMNKAYLSLPEGTATAAGLIAMMTDHYNVLEGADSELESTDLSRTSRKASKRGQKDHHLIYNGSDEPQLNLLQYPSTSSSYGCLSFLRKQSSGGSLPRVVGKRTPRVPIPYFANQDNNNIFSPRKEGLKPVLNSVDDDGAHVAALTLAEASLQGVSVQVSLTSSRRLGHRRQSPDPSGERKMIFGDSKVSGSQMDDNHAECSLGSSEAESCGLSKDGSISEIQKKEKKFLGKRSKSVEDYQFDDQKESCIGTNEGLILGKIKAENGKGLIVGKALRPLKGPKKRSHHLFFGDECSALDALQTLANLTVNAPFPVSTDLFESSVHVNAERLAADTDMKSKLLSRNLQREKFKISKGKDTGNSLIIDPFVWKSAKLHKGSPHDTKSPSETKHQICSSNNKMHKRMLKSPTERFAKPEFPSDFRKLEYQNTEIGRKDGRKCISKVERVRQVSLQPKQGKSPKPEKCLFGATNCGRVVIDANQKLVACSPRTETISSTKSGSHRKMDLQKAVHRRHVKSGESAADDHPERYSLSNIPCCLKETLSHCFSSQQLRRWCKFEWFYSAIDSPWFSQSEFIEYLNHVGLNHIPKLTSVEWGVIRSSLGKPRRFSNTFLQQELEKLEEYREFVRSQYVELCDRVIVEVPTGFARPLSVGQRVIACHPRTREIYDGSILTVDRNQCRIQFDKPELGVELVMDIDCMPLNPLENMPQSLRRQNPANNKFCNGSYLIMDGSKDFNVRGNMMSSAKTLETDDGASNVSSYCYPMSTLMNHAKAKSQAREADVRALANLCSALDKKEALIMELRQMDEIYGNQNDGDPNIRKQLSMVRLQLPDVNDQVASALIYLQQRNTYCRNLAITLHKSVESSECQDSFNSPPLFTHDSGSLVSEVFESSREKTKAMVDVAVQAMHALKEGEDAFHKIGEALNLAGSTNPGSISSIATAGNALDQGHDNSIDEDHASSQLDAASLQAPCSNLKTFSHGNQASELISSCVATLFIIQVCTEEQYPPAKVAQILDSALASLQPCCPQNLPVYKEIEKCMGIIKNQMLSLVPTTSALLP